MVCHGTLVFAAARWFCWLFCLCRALVLLIFMCCAKFWIVLGCGRQWFGCCLLALSYLVVVFACVVRGFGCFACVGQRFGCFLLVLGSGLAVLCWANQIKHPKQFEVALELAFGMCF